MADLSNQIKAFLVEKGKTEDEVDVLFRTQKIILQNDGTGTVIKTWTVDGISKPTISDMSAYDSAAANYETKMQVLKKRAYCYPSIQEQFDMQYWDAINGTTKWKDAITKVKSDNPKPS
tara:strand:+ start:2051 stop:2407 length:357 start_codon:yes stop_codon:yes gene_type:complete